MDSLFNTGFENTPPLDLSTSSMATPDLDNFRRALVQQPYYISTTRARTQIVSAPVIFSPRYLSLNVVVSFHCRWNRDFGCVRLSHGEIYSFFNA